jgi:hypothetical protein
LFKALSELEALGVIDRRILISHVNGRNAPTLYRIGGRVKILPEKARRYYTLAHKRKPPSIRARKKKGEVLKRGT